jgi:uncharacterized protein YecE (DUF72 family)
MTDPVHDPGPAAARARADAVPLHEATIVHLPGGGAIRVGTAGWTDPSLTAGGVFYPPSATSAEDRLRYYASRFPVVEIDASYYALPTRRLAELWLARTPGDFIFNVKAFALMTGHATEVRRLPRELREALPAELAAKERIYGGDLPAELYDAVWRWFVDALEPLHAAGKLGAVLLQYPRWFVPGAENRAALADAKRRLGEIEGAVEFRNRRWFDGSGTERTLRFLADHGLPFVMVDEPQGMESSVPPVVAVTSPRLGMLRLHGRRCETWEKKNAGVDERFRYFYAPEELQEWVPNVLEAARDTRELYVTYNNCHANYGTTNALEFTYQLVETVSAPLSTEPRDR